MPKEGRLCWSCNRAIQATCHGYQWYAFAEIRFCRSQMLWLIGWLNLLREGRYPIDPYISGYVGGRFSGIRASASFEGAAQLAAEVEGRLWTDGRTGEAGEALVDEIQNQDVTNYNELSRPARRALNYISGFRRKRQTYAQWRRRLKAQK